MRGRTNGKPGPRFLRAELELAESVTASHRPHWARVCGVLRDSGELGTGPGQGGGGTRTGCQADSGPGACKGSGLASSAWGSVRKWKSLPEPFLAQAVLGRGGGVPGGRWEQGRPQLLSDGCQEDSHSPCGGCWSFMWLRLLPALCPILPTRPPWVLGEVGRLASRTQPERPLLLFCAPHSWSRKAGLQHLQAKSPRRRLQ